MNSDGGGVYIIHPRGGKGTCIDGNLIALGSNLNHAALNSANLSAKKFMLEKERILSNLKQEAEENVLKERVLALIKQSAELNEPNNSDIAKKGTTVQKLPPQPCVILQPVLQDPIPDTPEGVTISEKMTPPIIIPGRIAYCSNCSLHTV